MALAFDSSAEATRMAAVIDIAACAEKRTAVV